MILMSLFLSVTALAFTTMLAINPLTLGILILLMALSLAMLFATSMSSWVAFLIFLIYIGGMLVMFSYFVSLTPNQSLPMMYNMFMMMISLTVLIILTTTINMYPMIMSYYKLNLTVLYTWTNMPMLLILASVLLLAMIIVVKLTTHSKGPLRPFSKYV